MVCGCGGFLERDLWLRIFWTLSRGGCAPQRPPPIRKIVFLVYIPVAFAVLLAVLFRQEQVRLLEQERLSQEWLSRQAGQVLGQSYWDESRQDIGSTSGCCIHYQVIFFKVRIVAPS